MNILELRRKLLGHSLRWDDGGFGGSGLGAFDSGGDSDPSDSGGGGFSEAEAQAAMDAAAAAANEANAADQAATEAANFSWAGDTGGWAGSGPVAGEGPSSTNPSAPTTVEAKKSAQEESVSKSLARDTLADSAPDTVDNPQTLSPQETQQAMDEANQKALEAMNPENPSEYYGGSWNYNYTTPGIREAIFDKTGVGMNTEQSLSTETPEARDARMEKVGKIIGAIGEFVTPMPVKMFRYAATDIHNQMQSDPSKSFFDALGKTGTTMAEGYAKQQVAGLINGGLNAATGGTWGQLSTVGNALKTVGITDSGMPNIGANVVSRVTGGMSAPGGQGTATASVGGSPSDSGGYAGGDQGGFRSSGGGGYQVAGWSSGGDIQTTPSIQSPGDGYTTNMRAAFDGAALGRAIKEGNQRRFA